MKVYFIPLFVFEILKRLSIELGIMLQDFLGGAVLLFSHHKFKKFEKNYFRGCLLVYLITCFGSEVISWGVYANFLNQILRHNQCIWRDNFQITIDNYLNV